jgi:hypothetical protein
VRPMCRGVLESLYSLGNTFSVTTSVTVLYTVTGTRLVRTSARSFCTGTVSVSVCGRSSPSPRVLHLGLPLARHLRRLASGLKAWRGLE